MNTQAEKQYFNLHTSGVGYLNRVRWVEPKGRSRDRFLACSVAALSGDVQDPRYTYLDMRVSGGEAIKLVADLKQSVDAREKVFIAFKMGDLYPHMYERDVIDRDSGRKTGQREMACIIKGRLLQVNSVTIDGERVFTRSDEDAQASSEVGTDDVPAAQDVPSPQSEPAREPAPAREAVQARAPSQAQPRPSFVERASRRAGEQVGRQARRAGEQAARYGQAAARWPAQA